ncbi:MAG: ubiquinone/menaquinone biosynthesis methyltransferase [Candidatus Acidoferrum typicum]|nr:ubiquinone/menaquinone biosynthesis methyltransferase [Candidatus Acidoferrum typicum]
MYSPKEYWAGLAEQYDSADSSGFAPILHPEAPSWFNDAIDHIQFRAVERAVAIAKLPPGARFLDVGCGTGRWVRRYRELGFSPMGVDATIGMLHIARSHRTSAPLAAGLAYNLPFPNDVFDCISDITVVQHIPHKLQPAALREMIRVLKPGGRMILFELIRGEGSHIFPRKPQDWIREVESCGATLIGSFGQEYFFPDRLFVRLTQTLLGRKRNHTGQVRAISHDSPSLKEKSLTRRLYWRIRRIIVPFSVWTEPVCANVFPASTATHGVFVFRKKL